MSTPYSVHSSTNYLTDLVSLTLEITLFVANVPELVHILNTIVHGYEFARINSTLLMALTLSRSVHSDQYLSLYVVAPRLTKVRRGRVMDDCVCVHQD